MKRTLLLAACAALCAGCASMNVDRASATAFVYPASGSGVKGTVSFMQIGHDVTVSGEISGLTPGPHGFHVHDKGDCSAADASSAGGHFNPTGAHHGGPQSASHHAGDLGNITANDYGIANVSVVVQGISVKKDETNNIIGRGLVVHAKADDEASDPAGNSGARVGCGVIQP